MTENDAMEACAACMGAMQPDHMTPALQVAHERHARPTELLARIAMDDGTRHDLDDVIEAFGFSRADLEVDDSTCPLPPAVTDGDGAA